MRNHLSFCLNGYGYLHNVVRDKNGNPELAVVKICHGFNEPEEVNEIFCHPDVQNPTQAKKLNKLWPAIERGECILLKFKAAYDKVETLFAKQRESTGKHSSRGQIEVLKGRLLG